MKTFQQVLVMATKDATLRSEATGWGPLEDGKVAHSYVDSYPSHDKVGMIPGPKAWYSYPTVLHALGHGWKLLAPPLQQEDEYEWWLVREVDSD